VVSSLVGSRGSYDSLVSSHTFDCDLGGRAYSPLISSASDSCPASPDGAGCARRWQERNRSNAKLWNLLDDDDSSRLNRTERIRNFESCWEDVPSLAVSTTCPTDDPCCGLRCGYGDGANVTLDVDICRCTCKDEDYSGQQCDQWVASHHLFHRVDHDNSSTISPSEDRQLDVPLHVAMSPLALLLPMIFAVAKVNKIAAQGDRRLEPPRGWSAVEPDGADRDRQTRPRRTGAASRCRGPVGTRNDRIEAIEAISSRRWTHRIDQWFISLYCLASLPPSIPITRARCCPVRPGSKKRVFPRGRRQT
jgi:hypothetical protein